MLRIQCAAYAHAGVPEAWIARPHTRDVLQCSQPDVVLGDYAQTALLGMDSDLVAVTMPARMSVADLFAGAPDTTP